MGILNLQPTVYNLSLGLVCIVIPLYLIAMPVNKFINELNFERRYLTFKIIIYIYRKLFSIGFLMLLVVIFISPSIYLFLAPKINYVNESKIKELIIKSPYKKGLCRKI
jgi:hypothetical protein